MILSALLSLALATSGCALFWVGAGATGGYLVATDERSAGTIFDDAAITTKVKTKFATDSQVDAIDINVDTHDGVVSLHGHVHGRSAKNRAISIARGVKGVRKVESFLEVLHR